MVDEKTYGCMEKKSQQRRTFVPVFDAKGHTTIRREVITIIMLLK